jgi:hypothetical protein
MKEELRTPFGVVMAIVASGVWVFWGVLAVFVLPSPLSRVLSAVIAMLMGLLLRGIAFGRPWARWTAFAVLGVLGLAQGIIVIGIAVSLSRPEGPKPISSGPIMLLIPLLSALFCLVAALLLLRKNEAAHFKSYVQ